MIESAPPIADFAAILGTASVPTVVIPATAEHLAQVLSEASTNNLAVVPWGGGCQQRLGGSPRQCDIVVRTTALSGVVFYTPEDLTIGLRSGTTVQEAQAVLAEHGQFLPLDGPDTDRLTVGGLVATALQPIRRSRFGGVRDVLIGLEVALADGSLSRSGGRVVKNVAGYDLCKLFSGSLGTLGVLTEVNFKVQPALKARSVVTAQFATVQDALLASQLFAPTAAHCSAVILEQSSRQQLWTMTVLVEGFASAAATQVSLLTKLLPECGGIVGVKEGPDVSDTAISGMATRRSSDGQNSVLVLRGSVLVAHLAELVAVLERLASDTFRQVSIQLDAHLGIFFASIEAVEHAGIDEQVSGLARARSALQAIGGYLVLADAPLALRRAFDVWGAPVAGEAIARRLKSTLDPAGVLNPGRFSYGI